MNNIIFYKLSNGTIPVLEFLNSIKNKKLKAKAYRDIEILKEFGTQIREPLSKQIEQGLFELRIQQSNDIARIFYFFIKNGNIIITNGFIKKTMKTPKSEIAIALKYKADYERRNQ